MKTCISMGLDPSKNSISEITDLMMIRFTTRFTYKRFKTEIARFLCMIFQNVIFLAFIRTEFARTIFTFQKRLFESGVCDICGKWFRFKCNAIRHREIHFEEKRFDCSICQMRFCHSSFFKRHMSLHDLSECDISCLYTYGIREDNIHISKTAFLRVFCDAG
jgi:hypothetical protein